MGKTVKSRSIMSVTSFLLVIAFCLIANKSVPKLYESYRQREAAQQASIQTAQVIKKQQQKKTDDVSAPEEPSEEDAQSDEDANIYDIPEEPVSEEDSEDEVFEEDSEDETVVEDTDTSTDNSSAKAEKTSVLEKILNFFKSLFNKIGSCKLLKRLKDFFVKFLKLFGVTI